MKKLFLFLIFAAAWISTAKEPLSTTLDYRMVTADQAEVTITVSGKGRPAIELPEVSGGRWLENQKSEGTSVQSSFINGKGSTVYTFTSTLPLLLTQESAVTIPPVIVTLDGVRAQTEKQVIPARAERLASARDSGNNAVDLSKLSATLAFSGGARHFAGENIEFTLTVVVPLPAQLENIGLPEFPDADKIVFSTRRNAALFSRPPERRDHTMIYRFDGAFRAMKSAEIATAAPVTVSLIIPDARQGGIFDDFFFGGMRGTRVAREVVCRSNVKNLQIVPLPPLPANAYDLAIAGKWRLKARFTPEKSVRSGEAMTLVVTGEGDRSSSALRAPKLSHEKIRIYPPEVKKKGNSFCMEYAMIPLTAGEAELDFPLAVFDPATGKYQLFHAKTHLVVEPGAATAAAPAVLPEASVAASEAPAPQMFFYPHTTGRRIVFVPLWKNVVSSIVAILGAAVLAGTLIFAWQKRRIFTPSWHRRAQKRHLHQLLKHADAKTLAAQFPGSVGELLQLPPGATTAEITAKITDPVMRDALEKCGENDFMPGVAAWTPDRKTRALLWTHCKRLFLLLAVGFAAALQAEHLLFDAGHFAEAAKQYEGQYDPSRADVDLLYNIGAAHFHAGNLAAARLALIRAHRLAPRDGEISARLAVVNEKLALPAPEISGGTRRIDRVIGFLRPDEWLLAGSAVIAAFLIALGFFPHFRGTWRIWASIAAVTLTVFCAAALLQEKSRLYFPGEAVVMKETRLRTLPSNASGTTAASLPAGSDLRILKKQGNWLLVETARGRGWVVAGDVEKLFSRGF